MLWGLQTKLLLPGQLWLALIDACLGVVRHVQNAPLVPEKLWVSAEKLETDGVYLLENGFDAWLYLGKAVSADVCMAVLGGRAVERTTHVAAVQLSVCAGNQPGEGSRGRPSGLRWGHARLLQHSCYQWGMGVS